MVSGSLVCGGHIILGMSIDESVSLCVTLRGPSILGSPSLHKMYAFQTFFYCVRIIEHISCLEYGGFSTVCYA